MTKYTTVFESERIYFVKVSEILINDYLKMINDKEVRHFISRKEYTPVTYENELNWIQNKIENNALCFSMVEKSTNEFIGNIEIMSIKNGVGELGISITKEQQNKHFGTEAIKAMTNYAFNTLKLEGLELNVYSYNPRGIKCYQNVGFIQDGVGKTEEEIHMILKR